MNTQYPNFMQGYGMPSFGQSSHQVEYVNGLESAKSYPLRPNESVILMDNDKSVFYHKQADASGFCTIKAYEFHELQERRPEDKDLTKKEFNEWLSQINAKQNGGQKHESSEK